MGTRMEDRMVDQMILAYAEWRKASSVVHDAYRSWASGTGVGAGDAFTQYAAALDTEEIAADVYAELVQRVSRLVTIGHDRAWQSWPVPWS